MTTPPIFISHSHLDNRECRDLVDFIAGQFPGADIFFDESNLHGGDDWMQRIQREVIARPIFIVVLSRHSVVAEWVREETNLALSRAVSDKVHRKVIPVQVDPGLQLRDIDQLAPLLTTRQILNFAPGAPASARDDLLRVLRGEISGEAPRVDPQQVAELETARDLANQVHTEIAAQHWLTAAKIARRAVTLPGNDRDAALWGELGLALLRTQDFLGANSALDTAVQVNRYRADLWRLKAQALAAQSKLDDAKTGQQRLEAASAAW